MELINLLQNHKQPEMDGVLSKEVLTTIMKQPFNFVDYTLQYINMHTGKFMSNLPFRR